jgi:hypothetical protein
MPQELLADNTSICQPLVASYSHLPRNACLAYRPEACQTLTISKTIVVA